MKHWKYSRLWRLTCLLLLSTVTWCVAADPDLVAERVTVSDRSVDPGQTVRVRWTARNRGNQFSFDSWQGVMWSSDNRITRGDKLLEREYLGIIAKGDDSPEIHDVKIPSNAVIGRTYYIGVYADYNLERSELSESNNGSNAVSVKINDYRPDFTVSGVTINDSSSAITVEPGQSLKVSWTARNSGSDGKSTKQAIMWSTNASIDITDQRLGDRNTLASLGLIHKFKYEPKCL